MPNRLIRSEMLSSEAVLKLPVEARWLFVVILLSADDLGLFEATEFKLARDADMRRETMTSLLQLLADADLVRIYSGPGMRQFGFIPKFRQRLSLRKLKHPLPPDALIADDEDALNKIKDLGSRIPGISGKSRETPANSGKFPPEAESESESEANTKPTEALSPPTPAASAPRGAARANGAKLLADAGVSQQAAADWIVLRSAKKLPLTQTALNAVRREATSLGMSVHEAVEFAIERGWGGFKASWVLRDRASDAMPPGQTVLHSKREAGPTSKMGQGLLAIEMLKSKYKGDNHANVSTQQVFIEE